MPQFSSVQLSWVWFNSVQLNNCFLFHCVFCTLFFLFLEAYSLVRTCDRTKANDSHYLQQKQQQQQKQSPRLTHYNSFALWYYINEFLCLLFYGWNKENTSYISNYKAMPRRKKEKNRNKRQPENTYLYTQTHTHTHANMNINQADDVCAIVFMGKTLQTEPLFVVCLQ